MDAVKVPPVDAKEGLFVAREGRFQELRIGSELIVPGGHTSYYTEGPEGYSRD